MHELPLVEAQDVYRRFRQGHTELQALQAASFVIQPGERIAIVGPSGSGKSTLLHLIGALDTPSGGGLRWPALGERAALRPRQIGLVFQAANLVPALSAVENVELMLQLAGEQKGTHERALAALHALDLDAVADKLPEALSGGQAQRVGIARALVLQPKLVLADEPTGQLDRHTADAALDALWSAVTKSQAALVVSTHDPLVAARFPVVWHMDHGVLTMDGKGNPQ